MVDRTKQPKGCTGISEKCLFALKSLSRATVVLQVLFLNLISFKKNAITRADSESRAEVFSLKNNK